MCRVCTNKRINERDRERERIEMSGGGMRSMDVRAGEARGGI